MNKKFTKLKGCLLTAAALSAFAASPALAQLNYRPTSAVNVAGTYTDLGTTGTAITVANNDDANSAAQPIGFTFNYNGQAFTDFVLNTNGFIQLGTTAPATANIFNWVASTGTNIIAPGGGVDLQAAANQTTSPTEYRVATTGTAGSRVTTIQWENVADKATPASSATAQFTRMSFQVKLYEGTNVIEFIYGPWISNGATTPSGQPLMIGLKGSSSAPADRLLAYKASSATAWTTTTFSQVEGGFIPSHFVRNTFLPDAGRTYRFTPVAIPANDLAVIALFVQGKISLISGAADTIQVLVKNNGTAAIAARPVTLSISGTHTLNLVRTVTLNPGEDSLLNYPFLPTTIGSNFVEATVPTDGDNTNNAQENNVIVTNQIDGYATYSSATATTPEFTTAQVAPYGNTAATNTGIYLAKFETVNKINITKVKVYIPGTGFNTALNNVGNKVFASVYDASGVELDKFATITLTAAMLDKFVDFTFNTPIEITNATYFAGVGVPLSTPPATKYTYPVTFNELTAPRLGTYFAAQVGGTILEDLEDKYDIAIEVESSTVAGIKAELNAKLVSVYPNPSNGIFNVSAAAMKGNNAAMEVRNVQGKVVYSAAADKNNAALNLSKLSSGIYMLKVSTDQEVAFKRLVIE